MTYHVEKSIDSFGKERLLNLIFTEGIGQIDIHKLLGLSTSDRRLNAGVYGRINKYLGIDSLPYPKLGKEDRKFQLHLDKYLPNYWDSEFLVRELFKRLCNPVYNFADNVVRYVIAFPRHPHSNKDSNQVKAHIIAWELYNSKELPEGYWVIPKDGDYTNLVEDNLAIISSLELKSLNMLGSNNPAYKHGNSSRPKLGGWNTISKFKRNRDNSCYMCKTTEDLVVHHIINYHLFSSPIEAHDNINLMTLCRSCHMKVHSNSINLQVLIEATQYEKLLELLETLKSQVPDTLMETYRDVEKQLGLTDNQQLSHSA